MLGGTDVCRNSGCWAMVPGVACAVDTLPTISVSAYARLLLNARSFMTVGAYNKLNFWNIYFVDAALHHGGGEISATGGDVQFKVSFI